MSRARPLVRLIVAARGCVQPNFESICAQTIPSLRASSSVSAWSSVATSRQLTISKKLRSSAACGCKLLGDLVAIVTLLDHLLNPANLALDALEPVDQLPTLGGLNLC